MKPSDKIEFIMCLLDRIESSLICKISENVLFLNAAGC